MNIFKSSLQAEMTHNGCRFVSGAAFKGTSLKLRTKR